jgi:hypothetical protein
MVHDAIGSGKNDITELSGGQELINELLEVLQFQIKSGRNDSTFV